MMSNTRATGILQHAIDALFDTPNALNLELVLTISGRCWHTLEPHLVTLMDYLAQHQTQAIFAGIFSDLVAIPSLRPNMLGMIRMQNRSETKVKPKRIK